ncbi:MAG TPA: YifB family Mg chelatase-like AAA ATPase [Candidatus Saccharimonadales bacterium]|nr:YifB family Mg chelatase-like AAA ATPase [Candidatus Saccharimonadales bacterium]
MGSVARTIGCALWGLDTELVTVEADVANGLPSFTIVGLPDAAVKEARERVRAAIRNAGFEFPLRRVTVNLAPVERRKEGSGFDLAIALAILRATDQLKTDVAGLCLGELGLDGAVRPVRGTMPRVRRARSAGVDRAYVAEGNAVEAAAAGIETIALGTLALAVAHLDGTTRQAPTDPREIEPLPYAGPDLGDVVGQEMPKQALELAAAGGHNLLFIGPPGTGKTLLARAFPGILPPLEIEAAMAASAIHSVAGLIDPEHPILVAPPFRAPHHTASRLSLVGGGTPPRPGEVSLAHAGTLFLDEIVEFSPKVLETLREPLEEGAITISRAGATATYPARFTLVAAMNPCPCGHAGDPAVPCSCLPEAVERYRGRLSGPVLDRIDLRVHVPRVPYERLRDEATAEPSKTVRARVVAARERMRARSGRPNAELGAAALRRHCRLDDGADDLIGSAMRTRRLSPRAYHRVLRVARTAADLDGRERITADDIATALLLRAQP